MKQLFKHFALLVMGALISGCAAEVDDLQPTTNGTVTMKTTISLSEQASTRALTEAGVKTFATGDKIAVIYKNTSDETVKVESTALTATDIDATDAHKATFSVSLTNPKAGTPVRYIYPAAMAVTTIATDAAIDDAATIDYTKLATQDGTLTTLANTLDLSVFDGSLTSEATLPNTATLTNPLTIGAFTIKNSDDTSDLTSTITGLTINDGSNTYAVTRTAAAGPIYVAMKPIVSTQTIAVDATDGTNNYTKSVSGNALAASSIYTITVKALKKIDLSQITAAYTAQNGDILSGTLDVANYPVKISIAAGATVTLNGLTINGINNSSYPWAGITCDGDATIILADATTNTVQGFYENYPGIIVAEGKTLTIKGGTLGTGKLIASSHYPSPTSYSAGIGGGDKVNCGNITISGGTIIANGGVQGAGIGGGGLGACGNITISGGTIKAFSGSNGAGIGGGFGGACVNITISGGEISAEGGSYGAGIGGGDHGSCGNITISGGNITSYSNWSGAGIGGGYKGKCGNIIITTSVTMVEATKGSEAQHSIGKGQCSDCGTVTIGGSTGYISDSPYTYQPPAVP